MDKKNKRRKINEQAIKEARAIIEKDCFYIRGPIDEGRKTNHFLDYDVNSCYDAEKRLMEAGYSNSQTAMIVDNLLHGCAQKAL